MKKTTENKTGVWKPEFDNESIDITAWFENEFETPLFEFELGRVLFYYPTGDIFVQLTDANEVIEMPLSEARDFEVKLYDMYMHFSNLRLEIQKAKNRFRAEKRRYELT